MRGRWYDIEGSPVYTAPMRARGIEPRSLPWRGSGLPLTDSRLSFEIGRVDGSNESLGRRADDCREAASTRRWATNERRERLASALPLRYTPSVGGGVGGVEPPISRSKYLPSTVRPCGIPESNGVLRFGGPPCGLHTHAGMLPPGFEPGSTRRGRGMRSVAPRQRCRQPESNRRPTFEGRRCLTALHHDGVAAPRFARGPRLCKSRILGLDHATIPRLMRKNVPTRHPHRRPATAGVDSRGFEPRLRFARAACFHYTTSPTSGEGVEPSRARRPTRNPPALAAWRLAVRPAGHRKISWEGARRGVPATSPPAGPRPRYSHARGPPPPSHGRDIGSAHLAGILEPRDDRRRNG